MASDLYSSGIKSPNRQADLPLELQTEPIPRPPPASPEDSDKVVLNLIIDVSYSPIPLSDETTNVMFPLSSLDSTSLLLIHTLALLVVYSKFQSLPSGDINWKTWVTCLKKFDGGMWRRHGIYQLIQISTLNITFNLDLLERVTIFSAHPCNFLHLSLRPYVLNIAGYLAVHWTYFAQK